MGKTLLYEFFGEKDGSGQILDDEYPRPSIASIFLNGNIHDINSVNQFFRLSMNPFRRFNDEGFLRENMETVRMSGNRYFRLQRVSAYNVETGGIGFIQEFVKWRYLIIVITPVSVKCKQVSGNPDDIHLVPGGHQPGKLRWFNAPRRFKSSGYI